MNAETLLETTLAVSAAALAVLVLRQMLRAMFGSAAAYAAWALVPAALLAVLLPAAVEPVAPARLVAGMLSIDVAPVASTAPAADLMPWLMVVWAAGAAATLLVFVVLQFRFRRTLGALTRRSDGLLQGEGTAGLPAVLGWPARIVLPADFDRRYVAAEQALVLCHEQVHLRRGDVPASAVAAVLRCLFWFNPLVHVAVGYFRQDQELACDAAVLRRFPGARRTYADALLKTQLADEPLPVGCHWFGSHPLKERIAMLKRPVPGSTRRLSGLLIAAVLATGGAALAWAAQPSSAQPVPAGKLRLELTVKIDDGAPMHADALLVPGLPHEFEFRAGDAVWRMQASVLQTIDDGFDLTSRIFRDGELVGEPRMLFNDSGAAIGIGEELADGSFEGIAVELKVTAADPVAALPGDHSDLQAGLETPPYPAAALAAGEGGVVMLKLRVGADGRVLESRFEPEGSTVAESSPLVRSARETSMRWHVAPAMQAGTPVEGWVQVPVTFDPDQPGG